MSHVPVPVCVQKQTKFTSMCSSFVIALSTCSTSQFQCKTSKHCIRAIYRCDDDRDCIDGSDEVGCKDSESKKKKQ